MLTKDQIATLENLSDEQVDGTEVISPPEVDSMMEEIEKKTNVLERWNVWNGGAGSPAPAISGSSSPSCPQNGNEPCASCDCC